MGGVIDAAYHHFVPCVAGVVDVKKDVSSGDGTISSHCAIEPRHCTKWKI